MFNPDECDYSEWHSVSTIQVGELIEGGFINWADDSWKWDYYSIDQYERVTKKFNARYYFREISITPPAAWKMLIINKFNEVMPKYKLLYKFLDSGADPLAIQDEYFKSRNIFSDFPATQLKSKNQDYASNATDYENEKVIYGDFFNRVSQVKNYQDVDSMLLDEVSTFFSLLYTQNINGI